MRNSSSTTVRDAGDPATPHAEAKSAGRKTREHLPPSDVVSALYAEHRYATRLIDVLAEQPLDRDAAISVMSYMTEHLDAYHHPREDAMFVRLAKRDPHLVRRIAEIERAHRTIGTAGKQLLAALGELPPGGRGEGAGVAKRIADYVAAMREHMTIEERDLFPRARAVLDDRDLAEIDRAFRRVVDPIFEASVRDAYAASTPLVRYLAEQSVVQQAFGAVDRFYESALTLGETLLGGGTGETPGAKKAASEKRTPRAPR